MITLSNTTALTKKVLKWASILIGVTLGILLIYRIAMYVKSQITPPPPPTASFGKLPPISFPEGNTDKSLTYSIDTVTGSLPVFPDRANVYKTVPPPPDLLALNKATEKILAAGFTGKGSQVSQSVYQWSVVDPSSGIPKKIMFNISSSNFNLSSPFLSDLKVLSANNLPNQTAAVNTAQDFLSGLNSIPQDLDLEKTTTTLLAIKGGTTVPTTSLSNTQVIEVSFFQKDLNNIPIVYPDTNSSTMSVFVSGGDSPQIIKADFFHQNIATESANYSILSSNEAYEKLKNGDAYISYGEANENVSINKVFLGYYLSDQAQDYVMPVVIFKGTGFTAYVSAVKDAWIRLDSARQVQK